MTITASTRLCASPRALAGQPAAVGARTIGGVRMLVLQGAFAFEQLTGHQAPVATMQQAVERALGA